MEEGRKHGQCPRALPVKQRMTYSSGLLLLLQRPIPAPLLFQALWVWAEVVLGVSAVHFEVVVLALEILFTLRAGREAKTSVTRKVMH